MKVRPGIVFLAAGMLAACAPDAGEQADGMPAAEATDMSTAEAAIEQVRADYLAAFNVHDAGAVAALFVDSAVMLAANGAVQEGREAIQASLTEQMGGTPTADIATDATKVFGDMAVSRGTYSVNSMTPDGAAMSVAGSYMSVLMQADGAWKIGLLITNLNGPAPEGFTVAGSMTEPPPENGTMTDLETAYEQAFNGGDAAAVAALFTDDAVMAFANEPVATGRAAIEASTAAGFASGSPKLDIHDVYTQTLGEGYALDAGWYTVTATAEDGSEVQNEGTYALLCRQAEDGSWKIEWGVVNGNPATM